MTVGGNVGNHLRLHPAAGVMGMFEQQAGTREQPAAGRGSVNMYEVGMKFVLYSIEVLLT